MLNERIIQSAVRRFFRDDVKVKSIQKAGRSETRAIVTLDFPRTSTHTASRCQVDFVDHANDIVVVRIRYVIVDCEIEVAYFG